MKITYLLGAGASANALPLIKKTDNSDGLSTELERFITQNRLKIEKKSGNKEYLNLVSITKKCIEFGTPDLYAKFLLETGDNDNYKLLKKIISSFFKYEQDLQKKFDYRALTFLTTITKNKKIPSEIRVLSWNYDRQLEIASEKMKPISDSIYNKVKGFSCWPNIYESYNNTNIKIKDLPFLFHLNGIAGYHYSNYDFAMPNKDYFDFDSTNEVLLSFAWEDQSNDEISLFHENRLSMAKELTSGTEIFVVIGYSFPFFNREIDKELFKSMKASLDKIYFQDPYSDGKHLAKQFDLSEKVSNNIVHITQIENYHIPFEL